MTKHIIIAGLLIAIISIVSTHTLIAQDATPIPSGTDSTAEELAGEIVEVTTEAAETTASTAQNLLERLVQVPHSDAARILLLIGGVILLLAGWRIHEFIILIAGFLIGAAVATSLVISDSVLINIAILLIGGLIGAALSAFVYYIAVFLIGAYVGIALTSGLATTLALTPVSSIALLIGGLIGGMVMVGLSFQFVVLLSGLVGAQMIVLALGLTVGWTIILTIIGVVVQLGLMRSLNYNIGRRPRYVNFFRRATR